MGEGSRVGVVEESADLVVKTEAFWAVKEQSGRFNIDRLEGLDRITELTDEIEGLNTTLVALRGELDAADAATSELKAQVHGLKEHIKRNDSNLASRAGMVTLLTEQRDEARANAREWQDRHKQAFSSRVRRLFGRGD